jgi:hypothetical protein
MTKQLRYSRVRVRVRFGVRDGVRVRETIILTGRNRDARKKKSGCSP